MSNVLPVIEMPKAVEPEPEPMLENPDGDKDLIDKIQDSLIDEEEEEEDIITIEPRDIPGEDEVFQDPPKMKPIAGSVEEPEQPNEFEPKKGKRKYVRKAPMSDKQKAHLERIRKIAAEKKRLKREEREEQKAEDKKLLDQKKQEEQDKKEEQKRLKEEKRIQDAIDKRFGKESKPAPKREEQGVTPGNYFTREDMEGAMLSAITSYDAVRKKQKKEKKEREAKELQEAQMRRTLQNAITPPQVQSDPWRSYFT